MTEKLNEEFNHLVIQLPILLDDLLNSESKTIHNLTGIPQKGIYVFYENNLPIYVGRSNRMKDRIQWHCRPSSAHNSATFAFNIAKMEAQKRGVKIDISRNELEANQVFAKLFSLAKERVSKMSIRVVEINDPHLQTIFEVYAALSLNTKEFNDFETH
jgi:hypothetical protein